MQKFFEHHKQQISTFLKIFLRGNLKKYAWVNRWGRDAFERLSEFTLGGKMLRGSLVILAYKACGGKKRKPALAVAAAVELLQSLLLIHDDIMDRDVLRRGKPAVHAQYHNLLQKRPIVDKTHFGQSMAICVGDISFFASMQILSDLQKKDTETAKIISLINTELVAVGLAQMEDMAFSYEKTMPAEKDIMSLYLHKTARYSFSLPLMLGAILAKAPQSKIKLFEKMGESLGLLFQLKDDELGIFGKTRLVGKSTGVDIVEGKKTLMMRRLLKHLNPDENEIFGSIFGNRNASMKDIGTVKKMLEKYDILVETIRDEQAYANKAVTFTARLRLTPEYNMIFEEFIRYNLVRTK